MMASNVILSFDVDCTLDISEGPIPSERVRQLKGAGFVVGFNGNCDLAKRELGPDYDFYESGKEESLEKLNKRYPDAVVKIHVGDDEVDKQAARGAHWIYIRPEEFR
jgi:hypothetical protein